MARAIVEVKLEIGDMPEYLGNCIFVWRFADAPPGFRQLSPHGGDEDWIAFIADSLGDCEPLWMEEGTAFGGSAVSEHEVSGGRVYIGAHA